MADDAGVGRAIHRTTFLAAAALIALVAATVTAEAATRANPLAGERLFLNSDTQAAADVQGLQNENPELANRLKAISESPQAVWLTTGGQETKRRVARAMNASASSKSVPVFVAYNIPARDCGSFSAGGAKDAEAYSRFVATIAKTIGKRRAAVVMEPDAIAGLDCLSKKKQRARMALIKKSVRTLEKRPELAVYIDAGHSVWKPVGTMAKRLKHAGVAKAHGFSLNVSNYNRTRGRGRLRHEAQQGHQGQALRHRHQPQRPGPRAGQRVVQPAGPRPRRAAADHQSPEQAHRRPALDQGARRVRRHLQRRPARGRVVA